MKCYYPYFYVLGFCSLPMRSQGCIILAIHFRVKYTPHKGLALCVSSKVKHRYTRWSYNQSA